MKVLWILFFALSIVSFVSSDSVNIQHLPTAFAGRFIPSSVYEKHWLYELTHKNQLNAGELPKLQKNESLSFIWQLHFFGHTPWDIFPLFWIAQNDLKEFLDLSLKKNRFQYNELRGSISKLKETTNNQELLSSKESLLQKLLAFEKLQGAKNNSQNEALKVRYQQLKSHGLVSFDIALQLEMEFPLGNRLQEAGDILKIIPGKLRRGTWYSPHAFHLKVYNPSIDKFELVSNFTTYSNDFYKSIRDTYFNWEKAVLENDYLREPVLRAEFVKQVLDGYVQIETLPYTTATGKQLTFPTSSQLMLEHLYFTYPFIGICIIFYMAAFLFLMLSASTNSVKLQKSGLALALIAFLIHTLILTMRAYILRRPPVANMLETVLYVPWVAFAISLLYALKTKTTLALTSGTLACILLLSVFNMSYSEERFENVQAVLDSQYWLIIHVLMVVGSYGAFILAALLGHIYVSFAALKKCSATKQLATEPHILQTLSKAILQTIYIGTFLLVGGTLLGGVWAAESWGRFWDWDPKESWAFISICIYLLCIHAYKYHRINNFGLAIGSILGLLIISFTWYGVNYILGSGLHSYGFGHGGQWIYYSYLLVELLFVTMMATVAWRRGFWKKVIAG